MKLYMIWLRDKANGNSALIADGLDKERVVEVLNAVDRALRFANVSESFAVEMDPE
jgi:hypothetical protein